MKKLILSELLLLFLATTFISDNPNPGWVQQTLPVSKTINDIFFLDSLTGWVVTAGASSNSDTGYIMKTTNGGENWIIQSRPIMNFNAVQFINSNIGYAGGGDGLGKLYKTLNGGINWNIKSSFGFITIKDLSFINNDTGWVCDDNPLNGGIFKTTNGGLNWTQQLGAGFSIGTLFFINSDTGWAGSADWKLYRTTNGGQVWVLQYTFTGAPNVFFPTKDTGYYYSSLKTTNGGFNWLPMNNGQGRKGLFFLNGKTGWAGDLFSTIQKTTDGQNWYNQTTPIFNNSSITFTDSLNGWAGGTGVVHTTDGGGPPLGTIKSNITVTGFRLKQNYPNPFNGITLIFFDLPKDSRVDLRLYNILGEEVSELLDDEFFTAGSVQFGFNAD